MVNGLKKASINPTVESLKLAQRIVESCKTERAAFREAVGDRNPSELTKQEYEQANDWRMSHTALLRWEKFGRQVLSIHEELVNLLKYSSSSKIEPEVFRTLPYINPMVVFPNPPGLYSRDAGASYRLLGFFGVARREEHHEMLDTHDPTATAFLAYCVVEIIHPDGATDIEFDFVSVPMTGPAYTMSECVQNVTAHYGWANTQSTDPTRNRFMRELLTYVLGAVMYLCSTTLEADKVPRKALLNHFPNARKPPFSLYRVGWQIGAALSASRRAVEVKDPSQQIKPGYEQDPQHRRAHFKTVWTGKGSHTPRLVFVAPYWTHLEKLGPSGVNTVRRVNPSNV
jgi:hypothetical protein